MTARKTDEIRKRLEVLRRGPSFDTYDRAFPEAYRHAPADLSYLLARVERFEGLLREVSKVSKYTCVLLPCELPIEIDASLGDDS